MSTPLAPEQAQQQLKPCPFCGGPFEWIDADYFCQTCGCRGPQGDTREECTERLNTRVPSQSAPGQAQQQPEPTPLQLAWMLSEECHPSNADRLLAKRCRLWFPQILARMEELESAAQSALVQPVKIDSGDWILQGGKWAGVRAGDLDSPSLVEYTNRGWPGEQHYHLHRILAERHACCAQISEKYVGESPSPATETESEGGKD